MLYLHVDERQHENIKNRQKSFLIESLCFYKSRKLCINGDENTPVHKIHWSWIRAKVFYPRILGVKEYDSTQEETPWTLAETPPAHYILGLWINFWLCVQKPFCCQVFCDPQPHIRLYKPMWVTTPCLRICSMHYRDPVTRVLSQKLKEITKL